VNTERLRNLAKEVLPDWARDCLAFLIRKKRALMPRYGFSFSNASENSPESPFPFVISSQNALDELGEKYRPTKRRHNYLPYYWMHFRDIRFAVKNVLEIGIQTDRSIRMWEEFFPHATIHGIDIDPQCEQFEGGRRKMFVGDQSDDDFLNRVVRESGGAFDIVIDDGSHRVEHQLKSFDFLFPTMSDHGIYVVEDTGGCVGDPELATVDALTALVDSIMYWPKGFQARDWMYLPEFPDEARWIDRNVIGIAFYRWIVFIMRGKNPRDNPFLAPLPSERETA
jgi:hypothetical protein